MSRSLSTVINTTVEPAPNSYPTKPKSVISYFHFSHLFLIISSYLQSPDKGCLLRHPLPLPATPLPQSCRDLHHLHPVRSPSQPPPPSIELSIVACRGHLRRQICLVFGGKDWIFMAPLSGSTSAQPLTGTSVATFFWLVIWGF